MKIANPYLGCPATGTLGQFLLLMFYMGKSDGAALKAARLEATLDTSKTTLNSVRRRRYEFQDQGHPLPSNAVVCATRPDNVIELRLAS